MQRKPFFLTVLTVSGTQCILSLILYVFFSEIHKFVVTLKFGKYLLVLTFKPCFSWKSNLKARILYGMFLVNESTAIVMKLP